jgi:myo-inositol catabolism protein IolS
MGGHGWGKVSEGDLVEAVHGALDHGVNFFDTADTYGLGKSEEILGSALKGRRQNAIIATKFGVRVENATTRYDNSPEWIDKAVCSSLQRLNTDYIDLYQIHYRDGKTPLDDVVFKLEELKEKGFIRYYGLCNIYQKDMPEIRPYIGRFVSFQDESSSDYGQSNRELLPGLCLRGK